MPNYDIFGNPIYSKEELVAIEKEKQDKEKAAEVLKTRRKNIEASVKKIIENGFKKNDAEVDDSDETTEVEDSLTEDNSEENEENGEDDNDDEE